MSADLEKLLPCPFCGARLTYSAPVAYFHPVGKCILSGRNFKKGTIGQWNKRQVIALTAENAALRAKAEKLADAANEAQETLRLVEHPAFPDPTHHETVKSLGRRIGFGALMSTASAGWREVAKECGHPPGGEYVAGPCFGTIQHCLKALRAALAEWETP